MISSSENLDWNFFQVLKGRSPQSLEDYVEDDKARADSVSALDFDESGNFLAVGNRGGRILLFNRGENSKLGLSSKVEVPVDSNAPKTNGAPTIEAAGEYDLMHDFRSHDPEFDCLKSLEIEEKINKIKWCKRQNSALFLLSTNDKTIKLWKISERKAKNVNFYKTKLMNDSNHHTPVSSPPELLPNSMNPPKIPLIEPSKQKKVITSTPRRIYSNAHAYHNKSISLNSDGETFISSDDLRINLWNLNITNQTFTVVDMKPAVMEDLTEVVTSAEFHPSHCNLFIYSSSRGTIRLADMRLRALCDKQTRTFEEPEDPSSKTFFSEMIASISDLKFTKDGRYIISRDYLTIKLWDMNMENKPVRTFHIHDFLRPKLCDLYDNDCIFDKFECAVSHNGNHFLTGSYHNNFHIFDKNSKMECRVEASKNSFNKKQPFNLKPPTKKLDFNPDNLDYGRKALHVAWHPQENLGAVGADNKVFLFKASS